MTIVFGLFSVQLQANDGYETFTNLKEALEHASSFSSSNVRILDLSRQKFAVFPKEIWELKKLVILNINTNQLDTLPKEIGQLKNLQMLDLSHNQFTALPREIGQLQSLTELYLQYNQLVTLPDEIIQLQNLRKLTLYENPISQQELNKIRKLLPNCQIYFEY
ncbi:leucine rich repeat protein [Leptospira interrogans serovar Valbuzzi str. Valbuzzi]|nr:leucine-rich repeat domain-containing protein [Leptospira interrogans]ENO71805.1 leucine rich repeat protein [Leptospira interrogans serovar Valbuzzi str. Valbuzzi]